MESLSWKLAFRNLLRNKRRSLATGIAILTGYVGLVLLGAYLVRAQNGLRASSVYLNHKGHIAIVKNDSLTSYFSKPKKYVMNAEEVTSLENVLKGKADEIEFTGKYLTGTGLISNGHKSVPFLALGFEPAVYQKTNLHPEPLKWASDWVLRKEGDKFDDFVKNPLQISITHRMAELLGLPQDLSNLPEATRTVQLAGKSFYNDLNAVNADLGSVHTTGLSLSEDTSLRAPLALLQQLYATDGIEYLAVYLKNVGDTASFKKWLQKEVKAQGLSLEVYAYNDDAWNSYFVGSMGFLYVMITFFIFLICGAIILSIVNSTTMGLLERLKEIGTLRAIGFSPGKVSSLFVQEVFLLGSISVVSGLIISLIIASAVNSANIQFSPPGTQGSIQFLLILNVSLCLGAALFLITLTTGSAAIVSYIKNKSKIVELLADTGA
ncbi:ABC transporter permease [Bdellovibrio svalbardensis]|uniref:FtsX-like permease family protein n=1 Tax=Bdellovibrio svalbardensis TaxID=2972972 RepID=A0ABT6DF44_9BACT|nr:FtsX-like permease family protein [Bdellovibrio svalbardensis]MDG0815468.1 FtsX-like permease family protein [Bdellovibrio svalbardensis]